jgi:hypothetical protein
MPAVSFRPGRSSQGNHIMTLSARNGVTEASTLSESLELYHDLSDALRERISVLKSDTHADAAYRHSTDMIRAHYKALLTVIDLEESLAKHTTNSGERSPHELDLESARAEIAARLSVWAADRGS